MRTALCWITSLTFLVIATFSLAQQNENDMLRPYNHENPYRPDRSNSGPARSPLRINPNFPRVLSASPSLSKGAVHLKVQSDADAQRIFTHFPSPSGEPRPG